jgi:type IV pilus assembly protein PilO
VKPRRRTPASSKAGAGSTNRAVIALALLGSLVLLYGWNSVFLAPRSKARAQVQKDLAASRRQEEDLRQSLAELRKLATNTQVREAELAHLGRLVPADPDVAGAITALNETANQAQVAWSSFVPAPPAPSPGGAVTVGITMKVAGTFPQIFDYLRRLETLDRLVVVDALTLSAGGTTGGSPQLTSDIKARMFAAGTGAPMPPATVASGSTASPSESTALTKAGD